MVDELAETPAEFIALLNGVVPFTPGTGEFALGLGLGLIVCRKQGVAFALKGGDSRRGVVPSPGKLPKRVIALLDNGAKLAGESCSLGLVAFLCFLERSPEHALLDPLGIPLVFEILAGAAGLSAQGGQPLDQVRNFLLRRVTFCR